jgi:hypothetical protein
MLRTGYGGKSAAKNGLGLRNYISSSTEVPEQTGQDQLWMWIRSCVNTIAVVSGRWVAKLYGMVAPNYTAVAESYQRAQEVATIIRK